MLVRGWGAATAEILWQCIGGLTACSLGLDERVDTEQMAYREDARHIAVLNSIGFESFCGLIIKISEKIDCVENEFASILKMRQ